MSKGILTVQIHPDLLEPASVEGVVAEFRSLSERYSSIPRPTIRRSGGRYINIKYASADLGKLWRVLRTTIFRKQPKVKKALIVVCTGSTGWKDFLLLHHYDRSQRLDRMPGVS